ncbi:MAG: hypothetical protein K0R66_875 [Gammaproteobacteria bacterium]|jgi:hypothetical protein|nr:hypothetical protein [Gammaproteobacteria bacterium]
MPKPGIDYSRIKRDMQKTGYGKKWSKLHGLDISSADLHHSSCTYDADSLPEFRFTHLGQFHIHPGWDKDRSAAERIIHSQFMVAQNLLEMQASSSNMVVISESLNEDLDWDAINKNPQLAVQLHDNSRAFKAKFPEGFPKRLESLNLEQQFWLAKLGAPTLLFFLGQLPLVYKSLPSDKVANALGMIFADGNIELDSSLIEQHSIHCLKRALEMEKAKSQDPVQAFHAVIVYGTHHDFSFIADDSHVISHQKIDCHKPLTHAYLTEEKLPSIQASPSASPFQEAMIAQTPIPALASPEPTSSSATAGNVASALLFGALALLGARCCMRRRQAQARTPE